MPLHPHLSGNGPQSIPSLSFKYLLDTVNENLLLLSKTLFQNFLYISANSKVDYASIFVCERQVSNFLIFSQYRRKGTSLCVDVAEVEWLWKLRFIYASSPHIYDSNPSLSVSFRLSENYCQQNFCCQCLRICLKSSHICANSKNFLPELPCANGRRPMSLLQYPNISEKGGAICPWGRMDLFVEKKKLWKLSFIYTSLAHICRIGNQSTPCL